MANSAQAKKRARQNEKARLHNKNLRSSARTTIKQVRTAITGGSHETAMAAFRTAVKKLDSMVNKKIFHKNTISRYKKRMNANIKNLSK